MQWTAQAISQYQQLRSSNAVEEIRSTKYPTLSPRDTFAVLVSPGSQSSEWVFTLVSRRSWYNALVRYSAAEYLNPRITALHDELCAINISRAIPFAGAIIELGKDWSALLTMRLQFDGEHLRRIYTIVKHGSVFWHPPICRSPF